MSASRRGLSSACSLERKSATVADDLAMRSSVMKSAWFLYPSSFAASSRSAMACASSGMLVLASRPLKAKYMRLRTPSSFAFSMSGK